MRYATPTTWAEYFEKEEGLIIGPKAIENRLNGADAIGIDGREKIGRIMRGKFYSEIDIKKACRDLLSSDLNQADADGFFEKDGIRYASITTWAKVLPTTGTSINKYLQRASARPVKGKLRSGNITDFYSELDVQTACTQLLNPDLLVANEYGFIENDGETYGTKEAWSRVFPASTTTITRELKSKQVKAIIGKTSDGRVHTFYPKSSMIELFPDRMSGNFPKADENGFFVKDGKKYGLPVGWSRILPYSCQRIHYNLKKTGTKGIRGRGDKGNPYLFFSEEDVLRVCGEDISDYPKAEKNGFFELNGVWYGSLSAWAKLHNRSTCGLTQYFKKIRGITARDCHNVLRENCYYSEPDVLSACADFISKRNPHAS